MKTKRTFNTFFLFILMLALLFAQPVQAAPLAAIFTVTNANDSGTGSLRQAILDAASGDTIVFGGNFTIKLINELPVNKNLTIDGSGYAIILSGDTNGDGTGDTRVLNIALGAGVTLNRLTIIKGSAVNGGGLVNAGSLTVNNATFSQNKGSGLGGAIYNSGALTVTNSTFSGNNAANGAGIYHLIGTLVVSNSTFAGNTATKGGGIYTKNGVTLTNGTFSDNAATSGGGGIYRESGTAALTNTILANSAAGGNCWGEMTNISHNLDSGWTCGFSSLNGSLSNTNPLLATLGNYGGPTRTFALLPGSPALDAGDDSVCGTALGYVDQRGVSRLSSLCDMGAYESRGFTLVASGGTVQSAPINTVFPQSLLVTLSETDGFPLPGAVITYTAPFTGASAMWNGSITTTAVTTNSGMANSLPPTANEVIGSYSVEASVRGGIPSVTFALTNLCAGVLTVTNENDSGEGSLRQAIENSCAGGKIIFAANYTIRLASRLTIDKNLDIDGAGRLIILNGDSDRNGTGDTSLLLNDTTATTTMNRVKFVNGAVSSGGGIRNNGILTLTNCTLDNNSATADAGAIYNAGTLNVANCTLSGNSAVGNGGAIFNDGTLNVTNSTFADNTAASGGGIFTDNGTSTLMVNHSTFAGNSATSGGGIYKGSGTVTVKNSILSNNGAGGNCSDVVTNGGYNLDDGITCGFDTINHSKSDTDPLLSALSNYGGPTKTFALLPGSPALDAANSTGCLATDQRGIIRPQGSGCDMGAFELKQYRISGNAGQPGVTLSYTDGIARKVTSASDRSYSLYVSIGWSGTVTPAKTGYIFRPASITYTNVTSNKVNQNYTAIPSYIISGNAGQAGVILTYKDITVKKVVSGPAGYYSFKVPTGWSGAVTPSKSCYTFTPANRTYVNVTANKPGQNYTPVPVTFTISGNAGVGSAALDYTDGTPKTVTADSAGVYSLPVSCKWSGTVTPSKIGYTFDPLNKGYTNVLANQVAQNYVAKAITYTISGNAGVANALLHYTDGSAKTVMADDSGLYSLKVSYNWSGTVTPSMAGKKFTPESLPYTNVLADVIDQNYTAEDNLTVFTISGNAGIANAVLNYTDEVPKTVTADVNGDYVIPDIRYNWSGTVTPILAGYYFTPNLRTYAPVLENQIAQDYTADPIITTTFTSTGAEDGWVLELDETSNKGGSYNSNLTYFRVGDDAQDRQYKAILSFDTSGLPDEAIITSAVLKIKQYSTVIGTNPFTALGGIRYGIRSGSYGTSSALETGDFEFKDTAVWAGTFINAPVSNWYNSSLNSVGRSKLNKLGLTQFRLYCVQDDNDNNTADLLRFLSGDYLPGAPQLIISYILP